MVSTSAAGEIYKKLEIIDYQFTLLSMIHDAQRWAAGQERIYFNPQVKKTLADRIFCDLRSRLFDRERIYTQTLSDVQVTIETALVKVKSYMPAETKKVISPTKLQRIWTWIKGFVKEAYRITIKSFFDSAMNK